MDRKLTGHYWFLSEEYPEYVGSSYNDFFTATVNGTNIALDQVGNVVTVNNVLFDGSLSTAGTFFDGRTSMLTASYTIPGGETTLNVVLSVGDVGDGIYDSGVIVDNVRIEVGQIVWLNFEGTNNLTHGEATWNMPAFQPTDLGYADNSNRATVISDLVSAVQTHYAGLDMTVTATQPTSGDYTTVHIGGNDNALNSGGGTLFGQADDVDIGNRTKVDDAVVFSQEFGSFYGVGMSEAASVVRDRLAITITHELAHNLGLRHVDNAYNDDIMKKNSPRASTAIFGDALKDLPASEKTFWPDNAQQQNDMEYARSVLGTSGSGTSLSSSMNWLWNSVHTWFTFFLDTTKPIYDVTIGTGTPLVAGANGAIDDDIAPQVQHFDVLDPAEQLQLSNFTGQDKFFLLGSSKLGGPTDITTGALDAAGNPDLTSAMVDMVDVAGNPLGLDLFKASKGKLKPFTAATLSESQFANIDWAGPKGVTLIDEDGDSYTVTLKGPGRVAVIQDDTDGNGKGPIQSLILEDTDAGKSSLAIKVKKVPKTQGVSDGIVTIGSVSGTALKSFSSPACDVIGTGMDFTGVFLGTVKLHDLLNGADIIAGGTATQNSTLTLAAITANSTITFGSSLKSLTAAEVAGGDITASAIKTLKVKGNFGANLTLTGAAETTVLGSLTIGGTLQDAIIRATEGNIGKVTVGAISSASIFAGYAGTTLPDSPDDFNPAASIAGVTVKGIKGQDSNMTNALIAGASIGKVSILFPDTGNGIAADTLKNLTVTLNEDGHKVTSSWKNLEDPADSFSDLHENVLIV